MAVASHQRSKSTKRGRSDHDDAAGKFMAIHAISKIYLKKGSNSIYTDYICTPSFFRRLFYILRLYSP